MSINVANRMSICQKLSHVSLLSHKSPLSNRQANSKSLKRDELASRDCVNSLDRFAKLGLWFLTILNLVLLIKRGWLGADMCSETLMLTDHTWNAGLVKQLTRVNLRIFPTKYPVCAIATNWNHRSLLFSGQISILMVLMLLCCRPG